MFLLYDVYIYIILKERSGSRGFSAECSGVERIWGGCCDDADDADESWLSDICIDYVYYDFGCSFCSFFFGE